MRRMTVRIKICGLTRAEDATAAQAAGAWALGFIFYPKSKRFITIDAAAGVIPPDAQNIGVFVNQMQDVNTAIKALPLSGVQLHGDETPDDARALRRIFDGKIIKAFRLKTTGDLHAIAAWQGAADYALVDAAVDGQYGGTGQTADWALAVAAKEAG